MNVINKILELFDELDAYESIELQQELAQRGYNLKINPDIKFKEIKKSYYGLFLENYAIESKIAAIKIIRNLAEQHEESILGGIKYFSLQEAKAFSENTEKMSTYPLIIGKKEYLESIKLQIEEDFNEKIFIVVKKVNTDNYLNQKLYKRTKESRDNNIIPMDLHYPNSACEMH